MPLYQLGSLVFSMTPFEVHDVTHDTSTDYAAKDVLLSARPREFVGEGDEHFKFIGTLFPTRFGGLTELQLLQAERAAHQPWPLVRGDGTSLGNFFIERIMEHDNFLTPQGIGRIKEYELHLVRSPYAASSDALIQVQLNMIQSTTPAQSAAALTSLVLSAPSNPPQ